jgi:uncharacterized protein YkwD
MRFRRAAALAVGLTTLGSTTPASAEAAPPHDAVERSVIRKLNMIRARHGLRPVRPAAGLARAADAHSGALARSGRLTHGAMSARVRRFVRARGIGETIARVPARRGDDARLVVAAWMRSRSHRATLLAPQFRRIGVARRAARRAMIFTVDLATAR